MIDIYIVTGFLGAGKTTFLKEFLRMFPGRKLSVIVNEFGQENVDGELLRELGIALQGVSGGSIFCACRLDQFEKALADAASEEPDVIVVETSGLSDPTGVRKVLRDKPEFQAIEYRGCICLTDAKRLCVLHETARVIRKQLSVADIVLLNKVDVAADSQIMLDMNLLEAYVRPEKIYRTRYGHIDSELRHALLNLKAGEEAPGLITADVGLHSITVTVSQNMTPERMNAFLERIVRGTYRVKGLLALAGERVLIDCVGDEIRIKPAEGACVSSNRLVVLYGYGQPGMKLVRAAAAVFPNDILSVEPR